MFRKLKRNRFLKYSIITITVLFAIEGFLMTATFVGIKLHIFKDPGAVDYNDRYFQKIDDELSIEKYDNSKNEVERIAKFYLKLKVLNEYYPLNAQLIHNAYLQHKNIAMAERMMGAIGLNMRDSSEYNNRINDCDIMLRAGFKDRQKPNSIFAWMNIPEWQDFKLSVAKDTALIDSAAAVMDIEPRLIVLVLLGEQMRLFNSAREVYKKVISPLKILSVEANFSLGVTGIKDEAASYAEKYLKDSTSLFYPGKKYSHVLDFTTSNITDERYKRLVNYRNHYYSYLYAAVILKEVMTQWKRSGFDISDRPEILATLFNVGYAASVPKSNPSVGGSTIVVNKKNYTFGALAYEFYYSGELLDLFPYITAKNKIN
jgi:hypothetical protein